MRPWDFAITSLAAWRLASLLVNEDGPGSAFARLRHAAGVRAVVVQGPGGKPESLKTAATPLAEALTCVWCTSVWTAGILLAAGRLPGRAGSAGRAVTVLLAASTGAIMAHEAIERCRR